MHLNNYLVQVFWQEKNYQDRYKLHLIPQHSLIWI